MTEPSEQKFDRREIASVVAMCILLTLVFIRALSSHEPFPMWDADPFVFAVPLTGITSGFGILLNACVMGLSLLLLIISPATRTRTDSVLILMLAIGFAGLGVHLYRDPETLLNGSTLGAMMAAMIASRAFLMSFPRWTMVVVPVALGAGALLAVYGFHQVFIQHPQTVAMYDQNRDAFLNARGWTDGSFEVLSYERRLRQPEPTGWFGLSNVYASFIASFGIAMVMVTLCSIRKAWWIASGLVAAGLLAMLLISKSKGGIGAAVLGFGTIQYALIRHRGRVSRIGTSTLIACTFVMVGVVGGAVLHQLSLLFRGQYMVGAMRIFAEHPIIGVGPGRFQDAYMIQKPSTSPEDVTSAHNLAFDLLAQMGLAGIAWIGVLVLLLWTSRLPTVPKNEPSIDHENTEVPKGIRIRLILLMILIAGVSAIRLQSNAMDIELMLLILLGIGAWMGLSLLLGVFGTMRTLRIAMLGGAVVLAFHAMLDLTPVWVVSAPLFGLCIGMGFRGESIVRTDTRLVRIPNMVLALSLGGVVALSAVGSSGVISRDLRLIELGGPPQELVNIRDLMQAGDPNGDVAGRTSQLVGEVAFTNPQQIANALQNFEIQTRISTAQGLIELAQTRDDPTLEITALEHAMKAAMALDTQGMVSSEPLWDWARTSADRLGKGSTFRELKWAGQASITMARHHADSVSDSQRELQRAMTYWVRADELNPHDPKHAYRIMELSLEMNDPPNASMWALEALKRSDRMRLDPLKQLSPESLRRARDLSQSE